MPAIIPCMLDKASFMFLAFGNAILSICSLAPFSFKKRNTLMPVKSNTNTQLTITQNDIRSLLTQAGVAKQLPFGLKPVNLDGMEAVCVTHRILILLAVGAIGGTLGDLCHVLSKTEGYPTFPFWVPLLFASAVLAIGIAHPWFDRIARTSRTLRPGLLSQSRVWGGLVLLLATWAASGFLNLSTGGSKDLVIAGTAIAAWWLLERTWSGIVLGLLTAVLGTTAEILQSRAGIFFYYPEHQNLWGVPSWLPYLYFIASVTTGNLGRMLLNGLSPSAKALAPGPSV
jgi:hypothetical protein